MFVKCKTQRRRLIGFHLLTSQQQMKKYNSSEYSAPRAKRAVKTFFSIYLGASPTKRLVNSN
jgi:hypothetical protein